MRGPIRLFPTVGLLLLYAADLPAGPPVLVHPPPSAGAAPRALPPQPAGESESATQRGSGNLVFNGDFGTDLGGWSAPPGSQGTASWTSLDADGSPTSGSALLTNDADPSTSTWRTQCIQSVPSSTALFLEGSLLFDSIDPPGSFAAFNVWWHRNATCTDPMLGLGNGVPLPVPGGWEHFEIPNRLPPAATQSIEVSLEVWKEGPATAGAHFDRIGVRPDTSGQPAIAVDGPNEGEVFDDLTYQATWLHCSPGNTGWTWTVTLCPYFGECAVDPDPPFVGPDDDSGVTLRWPTAQFYWIEASHPACPGASAIFPTTVSPIADFLWFPAIPAVGEEVGFFDDSKGGIESWQWSFGDGGSSDEQHPGHTFNSPGVRNVVLRVTSAAGPSASITQPVAIGDAVRLVSLGDSYSSGEGAGYYEPGTDHDDVNECHRSQWAWSQHTPGGQVAVRVFPGATRDFFACSGAQTIHLALASVPDWWEGSQLDHPELQNADAVTVTIGGNDAHFGPIAKICFLNPLCPTWDPFGPFGPDLRTMAEDAVERLRSGVLRSTFEAIKTAAPGASVYVVGYPQPLPATNHPPCFLNNGTFDPVELAFVRSVGDQLESALECSAREAGVHYVSVQSHFSGHEACGSGQDWIHEVIPFGAAKPHSLHPNARGQLEYARAVRNRVGFQPQPNPAPQPGVCGVPRGSTSPSALTGELRLEPETDPGCEVGSAFVPEQEIRIRGTGFAPNAAVVLELVLEGGSRLDLGATTADPAGSLDVVRTVPASAPPGDAAAVIATGSAEEADLLLLVEQIEIAPSLGADSDADGVPDICDNCSGTGPPDQTDVDGDGLGAPCDPCPDDSANDIDGDSLCADADPCPFDPLNDVDGDGRCGDVDNCPNLYNPAQADANQNGAGDACELFLDGFESGDVSAW